MITAVEGDQRAATGLSDIDPILISNLQRDLDHQRPFAGRDELLHVDGDAFRCAASCGATGWEHIGLGQDALGRDLGQPAHGFGFVSG